MKKIYIANMMLIAVAVLSPAVSAQTWLAQASDSIRSIYTQARKGNADSQNEVGTWFYTGKNVPKDYTEALQWWARAAKQDNVKAIGNMGLCYQTGNGIEADSLKASRLYLKSIEKGNDALFRQHDQLAAQGSVFSNMLVAECYRTGKGVGKDALKAVPYLERAAEAGNIQAVRDLALILLNSKRASEAYAWFRKGAAAGDASCTFYTGKMLLEGLGTEMDKESGANYMLRAADKDFPQAMYYLGQCYQTGDGVTRDAEMAFQWYGRAARKGVTNAQWSLAQAYRTGAGTPGCYGLALHWYGQASDKGLRNAFRALVNDSIPDSPFVTYLRGIKALGEDDFDQAMSCFKSVEKAKISDGKLMQALILFNPKYKKNNYKKAIKMLDGIATINPIAAYTLGNLYAEGTVDVAKDMTLALEYLTRAADMDYGKAQCYLAGLYFEGRGVDKDIDKAVALYLEAETNGMLDASGAGRLATCYRDGLGGLPVDEDRADALEKRTSRNNVKALLELVP